LVIQFINRFSCALVGASGQFEKRETSGIDNISPKASASLGVGARSSKRLVDKAGKARAVAGIGFLGSGEHFSGPNDPEHAFTQPSATGEFSKHPGFLRALPGKSHDRR